MEIQIISLQVWHIVTPSQKTYTTIDEFILRINISLKKKKNNCYFLLSLKVVSPGPQSLWSRDCSGGKAYFPYLCFYTQKLFHFTEISKFKTIWVTSGTTWICISGTEQKCLWLSLDEDFASHLKQNGFEYRTKIKSHVLITIIQAVTN